MQQKYNVLQYYYYSTTLFPVVGLTSLFIPFAVHKLGMPHLDYFGDCGSGMDFYHPFNGGKALKLYIVYIVVR